MQGSAAKKEQRAAALKLPALSSTTLRDRREFARYRIGRETAERRSAVRGLILLSLVLLIGSMARAGLERVFVHGWWRP